MKTYITLDKLNNSEITLSFKPNIVFSVLQIKDSHIETTYNAQEEGQKLIITPPVIRTTYYQTYLKKLANILIDCVYYAGMCDEFGYDACECALDEHKTVYIELTQPIEGNTYNEVCTSTKTYTLDEENFNQYAKII